MKKLGTFYQKMSKNGNSQGAVNVDASDLYTVLFFSSFLFR